MTSPSKAGKGLLLQVEDPAMPLADPQSKADPIAFDDDIGTLAVRMDDFGAYVKSGVIDFVADVKKRLLDEREDAVDLERRIAANRLANKQVTNHNPHFPASRAVQFC